MTEGIHKTPHPKAEFPKAEPKAPMPREVLSTLEETVSLSDSINTSAQLIDAVLKQMPEKKLNLRHHWEAGKKPRDVLILGADPDVMKTSKAILTKREFNEQMGSTIGKHRRK